MRAEKISKRRVLGAAALAAGMFAAASAAARPQAQEQLIDRVIAVVEDRALLQSELEMEYRRFLFQSQVRSLPREEEERMRSEFLEGLVADLLMAVHAEQKGIEIPDAQIDDEVERALDESRRAAGGDEAFARELQRAGLTEMQLRGQWREKIRTRRLIEGLMYREIRRDVEVSEGELRAYFRERQDELPQRPATVSVAHILILPGTPDSAKDSAYGRILEIEREIAAGMDFAAAAGKYSEDPSAKFGGSLGFVRLEDLGSPPFEAAARRLLVGEVSPPVLSRFGWHLIRLESVSGDEVNLRHILIRAQSGEPEMEEAARRAERVRQEILAGADFGAMAEQYSDDEKTKHNGGVIEGEIVLESLEGVADFFIEAIRDMGPGEITPVIREQGGFRIVKVLDRAPERPYTFVEARESLEEMIWQEKLQRKFQEYIAELKTIYHVDIKTADGG